MMTKTSSDLAENSGHRIFEFFEQPEDTAAI